jgi:hypothetical protein
MVQTVQAVRATPERCYQARVEAAQKGRHVVQVQVQDRVRAL